MGEKRFFKPLNAGGTRRARVRMLTRKGKIVEFTVQLEMLTGDIWQPIVRYDNAHNFAHRDELTPDGILLHKQTISLESLESVVEYAFQDFRDRADWYILRFEELRGR